MSRSHTSRSRPAYVALWGASFIAASAGCSAILGIHELHDDGAGGGGHTSSSSMGGGVMSGPGGGSSSNGGHTASGGGGATGGGGQSSGTGGTGGSCGNTQTDGKNCGSCGHDCLGAACTKGLCASKTLGTSANAPSGLAQFGTSLYWSDFGTNGTDGSIWTVLKATAGGTEIIKDLAYPAGISTNTNYLLFQDSTGTINISDMSGKLLGYGDFQDPKLTVFAVGDVLLGRGETDGVWTADSNGANAAEFQTNEAKVVAIATDDKLIYWSNETDLKSYDPKTAKFASVATGDGPMKISLNGTGRIAWWGTNGKLKNANTDGSDQQGFAVQTLTNLTADATDVYYLSGQTVMRASLAAGNPTLIANTKGTPAFIVVDDTYVYWLEQEANSSSAIERLAK